MAKVDLKIKSTNPTGTTQTTTISYVNPALTNAKLSELAHNLNGLTTNKYEEGQKVTTVNVDSEPDTGKTTPTFYLARYNDSLTPVTTVSASQGMEMLVYNGDATCPGAIVHSNNLGIGMNPFVGDGISINMNVFVSSSASAGKYPITFFVPETDNYKSATYEAVYTKS